MKRLDSRNSRLSTDNADKDGIKGEVATDRPRWIPVGHDVEEHDLQPLRALAGAIIHWDNERKRSKQELADEAVSDSPSFLEVGQSFSHALSSGSLSPIGDNVFAYISASAALYLVTQIYAEGKHQESRLKHTVSLLRDFINTKDPAVLHKASLELEMQPEIELNGQTRRRTAKLMRIYEAGDNIAGIDKKTARDIGKNIVKFGTSLGKSFKQTLKNAYWNNPRRAGDIASSAMLAAKTAFKAVNMKMCGKNEIHEDDYTSIGELQEAEEDVADCEDVDLSNVCIEEIADQSDSQSGGVGIDLAVLEESLRIDEEYQTLTRERVKFLYLTLLQGVFIGASVAQGVYNGLNGDSGWAFVNFSSASAASGPFKFFADTYVSKNDLLKTRRAEMGHAVSQLVGKNDTNNDKEFVGPHPEI